MRIEDLLPIGSVVLLKQGIKKLMIIGIKTAKSNEPEKEYDYIGVLYPEGYIGEQGKFLFDHDDINDIIFTGYNNPEREGFLSVLSKAYADKTSEQRKSSDVAGREN